jgi:hypothetical protein
LKRGLKVSSKGACRGLGAVLAQEGEAALGRYQEISLLPKGLIVSYGYYGSFNYLMRKADKTY